MKFYALPFSICTSIGSHFFEYNQQSIGQSALILMQYFSMHRHGPPRIFIIQAFNIELYFYYLKYLPLNALTVTYSIKVYIKNDILFLVIIHLQGRGKFMNFLKLIRHFLNYLRTFISHFEYLNQM